MRILLFEYEKTRAQSNAQLISAFADLIGNPEDRFSHNAAHFDFEMLRADKGVSQLLLKKYIYIK